MLSTQMLTRNHLTILTKPQTIHPSKEIINLSLTRTTLKGHQVVLLLLKKGVHHQQIIGNDKVQDRNSTMVSLSKTETSVYCLIRVYIYTNMAIKVSSYDKLYTSRYILNDHIHVLLKLLLNIVRQSHWRYVNTNHI